VTLDDIAGELYALPPNEFTAARNERAKQARQAGDKDLAQQITALGKPTMVGWLANQLVREHPDEMRALLDLGGSLREATASLAGDQLKELSRQQRQVVHALVQQARGLAKTAGHPASEDTARGLEETLHAALADEGAAGELAAGRLTGVLSRTGFPTDAPTAAPPKPPDDKALEKAARDATAAHEKAQAELDEASAALTGAADRVEELKQQLEDATEAQRAIQRRVREARDAAERAERVARKAQERLSRSRG
jgi:hypothetical protein